MKPSPGSPDALFARNRWTFSVGTLGRDMVYALVSLYLIFFLTEVLNASDAFMWWAGWLILAARLFDAVMDIVMGSIVDNTRSRWGHYKPWILVGALASSVCTLLLFTDLGLPDGAYVAVFALLYGTADQRAIRGVSDGDRGDRALGGVGCGRCRLIDSLRGACWGGFGQADAMPPPW